MLESGPLGLMRRGNPAYGLDIEALSTETERPG